MICRIIATCLVVLVSLSQATAQEKKPKKAEEKNYARAEIKGKLHKMGLKEKTWNVVVSYDPGPGAFYCPLIFDSNALKEAAERLKDKTVIVRGSILPNPALGGFGGESFLFVPGPIIVVESLRAAEKK